MNEETYGALKRIIEEVKEKRKAECLMKDCIINHIIGGNDIDLVETWIKDEDEVYCPKCKAVNSLEILDDASVKCTECFYEEE